MTHLFDRLCWAHENIPRVETDLVIVWEDPHKPDAPAKITVPAPEWLAAALHGSILPDVEHYHREARDEAGTFIGPKTYWVDYDAVGPLTEEQALEYLVMKDIPMHVWNPPEGSNAQHFFICRRDQIPKSRRFRNAWRIARDAA